MTNKERFLTMMAKLIFNGTIKSAGKFFNQDDWYSGKEIWKHIDIGFCLSPDEMKELVTKPAMLCRILNKATDDMMYRITKSGWERVNELIEQSEAEEQKPEEHKIENQEIEKKGKLQKILDYVPWCKADAINSCWKDDQGYWIQLNDGWNADRMGNGCRTINETTIYDLRYQIGGIKKVTA